MRKEATDKYEKIAIIGNNNYDMSFMKYLLMSQNIEVKINDNYLINDKEKDQIVKRMAYYFGTPNSKIVSNNTLEETFKKYEIPRELSLPSFTCNDMLDQINMCMNSDAVYVCNSNGELDKCNMFLLGYLMAMEHEIFFWNDIDDSEWLMSSIAKKTRSEYDVVLYPLEAIRFFSLPYLIDKFIRNNNEVEMSNYNGIDRITDFNLSVDNQVVKKNTVTLLGSLRKQLNCMKEKASELKASGQIVLAPQLSEVKKDDNGFIIFEDDISDNPIVIESNFIDYCLESENIIVCDEGGYIGNTVMFEIGYLLAKNKNIIFVETPKEKWLADLVEYTKNNKNIPLDAVKRY